MEALLSVETGQDPHRVVTMVGKIYVYLGNVHWQCLITWVNNTIVGIVNSLSEIIL